MIITPSYSFTRPSNTTAYTSGDLVANSLSAGSVVPMAFAVGPARSQGIIRRVRLYKSTTTATAATFIIHLFTASPAPVAGDNGAFAVATAETYLDEVAVDMSTTGSPGTAYLFKASATIAIGFNLYDAVSNLYGLIEVTGAYVPSASEVFTVVLEIDAVA